MTGDGSDGATLRLLLWLLLKNFLGETSLLNGLFDLLQDQQQAAYFSFRVLEIQIRRNSIHSFSAKFWLRIPIGDEVSIHLFCHSLGTRLRRLLRLVRVPHEFGLSGHAAGDCRLG